MAKTYPAQIPEELWNDLTIIAVDKIIKSNEAGRPITIGAHGVMIQILKRSVAAYRRIKERKAQSD